MRKDDSTHAWTVSGMSGEMCEDGPPAHKYTAKWVRQLKMMHLAGRQEAGLLDSRCTHSAPTISPIR